MESDTIPIMDEFINQLTSIVTTWQQAGALAGLILLVNLLTNLTKLQLFASRVPAAARAWVAAGLGTAGGLLTALASGKPVPQALLAGLIIGLGAIGTHELVSNAKPAVVALRANRAARKVAKAIANGTAIVLTFICFYTIVTMGSACNTAAVKHAEAAAIDCTKADREAIISTAASFVGPEATGQEPDWAAIEAKALAAGLTIGGCALAEFVHDYTAKPVKAGLKPGEVVVDRRWLAAATLEHFKAHQTSPVKFHTVAGDQ